MSATTTNSELKHWLSAHAGLDPGLLERSRLDALVRQRRQQLRMAEGQDYGAVLRGDADELEWLVEQVSVPETEFFRYPESFTLLIDHARSLRRERGGGDKLRMLSVACATGEEPYSMAMAAVEAGWPIRKVAVDAVDRSQRANGIARGGIYTQRAFRQPPPQWAQRWLQPCEDRIRIDTRITCRVRFVRADVLATLPPELSGPYDVVFCRNLLIYLNREAQSRLISRLAQWLSPDGLLFVGHAERVESLRVWFEPVPAPHAFALRMSHADGATAGASSAVPGSPRSADPGETTPAVSQHVATSTDRRHPTRTLPGRSAGAKKKPVGLPPTAPVAAASLEQARELADGGKLHESLAVARSVLDREGPGARILQLLGNLHLALDNLPAARDALSKALYFEPRNDDVLLQLSMIYDCLGDRLRAQRCRGRAARSRQTREVEQEP